MFLIHSDDETVYFNNGACHVVLPPNEVVEVENSYDAKVLMSEKAFHGIVEVKVVKGPRGTTFDVDGALESAKTALETADKITIAAYVEGQFEDRVKTGRPALYPQKSSRVARLLKKYNVDLKSDYGLDIISISAESAKKQQNAELESVKMKQTQLEQQNMLLMTLLTTLAGQNPQLAEAMKGVVPPTTTEPAKQRTAQR